jgi:hypothetical protein
VFLSYGRGSTGRAVAPPSAPTPQQKSLPLTGSGKKESQCRPIVNMLKTIDFIDVLKIDWRFNRHTPSHSIWSWQKALIFDGFHAFPVVWL